MTIKMKFIRDPKSNGLWQSSKKGKFKNRPKLKLELLLKIRNRGISQKTGIRLETGTETNPETEIEISLEMEIETNLEMEIEISQKLKVLNQETTQDLKSVNL